MDSNILQSVYLHLSRKTLLALACTSSSVARVLSDPFIWKSHLEKHEGKSLQPRDNYNWKRIYLSVASTSRYPEGCYTKCLADLEVLQVYIELQEQRWKRAVPSEVFRNIKCKEVLGFLVSGSFSETWLDHLSYTIVSALQRDDMTLATACIDLLQEQQLCSWKGYLRELSEAIVFRVSLETIAKLDKEVLCCISPVALGWRIGQRCSRRIAQRRDWDLLVRACLMHEKGEWELSEELAEKNEWQLAEQLIEKNESIVEGIIRYGVTQRRISIVDRMLPWITRPGFSQYTLASCCKVAMRVGDLEMCSLLLPLIRLDRCARDLVILARVDCYLKNRRELSLLLLEHLPTKIIHQGLFDVVSNLLREEDYYYYAYRDQSIEFLGGLLLGCNTDQLTQELVSGLCELMKLGDSLTELCLSDKLVRYLCFKRPDDESLLEWLRVSTHPAAVEAIKSLAESRPVRFSDALPYRALLQFTTERCEIQEILSSLEEATQYGLYKADVVLSLLTWLREGATYNIFSEDSTDKHSSPLSSRVVLQKK